MKRPGVIAQKLGMSMIFQKSGEAVPVTLFSIKGCCVVSKKAGPKEGQVIFQVANGVLKNPNKPQKGFFEKAKVEPKRILKTFNVENQEKNSDLQNEAESQFSLEVGTELKADYYEIGAYVDVSGVSIGKGFAGAMKRHNFSGLRATHGVSVSHRSHGSTGNRKSPAKVFKGKKMAGHMGCRRVTVQNLSIMQTDIERGIVAIKGSVPGSRGSWVEIRDALKVELRNLAKKQKSE